jgi:hypothetical protein
MTGRAKEARFAQEAAWVANAARVGRLWRSMAQFISIGLGLLAIIAFTPHMPIRQLLLGLLAGMWLALVVVTVAGFDDPLVRGDMAERWSAEALSSVRGWSVTNGLRFHDGDLDHLVVTPAGVLAVETKHHFRQHDERRRTAQGWSDVAAATRAARKARLLLLSLHAAARNAPVRAVLMIWGSGAPELPDGFKRVQYGDYAEVFVVDGNHPSLWSQLFNAPLLTPIAQDELRDALASFQQEQVAHRERAGKSRFSLCWSAFRDAMCDERSGHAAKKRQKQNMRRRHGTTGTGSRASAATLTPAAASDQ